MENEQKTESTNASEPTTGQSAGGCFGVIVVITVILWFMFGRSTTDYSAIATYQVAAMMFSVLDGSGGELNITDTLLSYPEVDREAKAQKFVDYWFDMSKPVLFPQEGVDADWLERPAARRMVKRRMVKKLLETTDK
jgi:hypothetical protein